MGLDAVVYRNAASVSALSGDRFEVDPLTGEASPTDPAIALPAGAAVALRVRLGNVDQIAVLRDAFAKVLDGRNSVILRKVVYSGTHCGDVIGDAEFGALESELGVLKAMCDSESAACVDAMQSLVEAARSQGKRVLAEAEAADAAAAEQLGEAFGRLRVTAPVLLGRKCVAPILLGLAGRHPRLELEMSFTDRPPTCWRGTTTLAIRNGTPPDSREIIARRLFRQDMVVCGAPSHLARRGVPRTLAALGEHDAILYSRSGYARGFAGPDGRSLEITPRSRVRLDDLEAIAEAAQGGHGLAWLPWWLVRGRFEEGALESVLADHPGFAIESHALWLRTPQLPPRVRVAVDALAEALPALTRRGDGLPKALGPVRLTAQPMGFASGQRYRSNSSQDRGIADYVIYIDTASSPIIGRLVANGQDCPGDPVTYFADAGAGVSRVSAPSEIQ